MGFGGRSADFYNYVGSSPVNAQDPLGLWTLDGYGNYMNDMTGGLYNWLGTNVFAPAITSVTGVSGLANATDTQLIIGTAGVTTIAVAGVVAAPAIASGLSSATAAVTSAATSVGAAAVAYGGTAVEAAAINAELTVGIGYSAYEIPNSTYQGKMSLGEAVVNGLMTWLSYGAPGLRLPSNGVPSSKPIDSGSSVGCQIGNVQSIGLGPAGSGPFASGGQLTKNACGMACGQRILAKDGIEVFQSNLTHGFYKGLTPQDLASNLNRFKPGWTGGFYYPSEHELTGISNRGPFITRLGGSPGHFVLVEEIENGMVKFWDPATNAIIFKPVGSFVDNVSGLV